MIQGNAGPTLQNDGQNSRLGVRCTEAVLLPSHKLYLQSQLTQQIVVDCQCGQWTL